MTQERTRKLGSTPEVTLQQKTSSHDGLDFSLLFPDMKSLYIYFGKKKKKRNAHVYCIFLYALAIVNLLKKYLFIK